MPGAGEHGGPRLISRREALTLLLGLAAAGAAAACSPSRPDSSAGGSGPTTTSSGPTTTSTSTTVTTAPPPPSTTSSLTTDPPAAAPPAAVPVTPLGNPPEAPYRPAEADGQLAGFLAIGDFGGGADQGRVAEAMTRYASQQRVDALVTTGDNVYDNGEPAFFPAQLDEPYRELRSAGRPFWTTLGNHDVVGGHKAAQLAWLGLPAGPYRKDLPGVRLLFLDNYGSISGQARWLDEQLSRPGPAASVVVFHAPIHSAGLHGPYEPLAVHWKPVIERHRVPLVLYGHDHLYQRFSTESGTTYVGTGGGGRELYQRNRSYRGPEPAVLEVVHHFVAVAVYDQRLVVTAVAPDDRVVDRVELQLLVPAGVAGS